MYIQWVGSTTIQYIACTLIMIMATSVEGVMEMGNTVARIGIKLHIFSIPGQCANHHIT